MARLRREGIYAEGRVIGTRAAAKRIVREAERLECDAIVMGADPPRGRLHGGLHAGPRSPTASGASAGKLPVYLVVDIGRSPELTVADFLRQHPPFDRLAEDEL